jgi:hypothetical protein
MIIIGIIYFIHADYYLLSLPKISFGNFFFIL